MRRVILNFSLLMAAILAIFFISVKNAYAQSNSTFTYDGNKLTHTYEDGTTQKTVTWTKYKGPVAQNYSEINQNLWVNQAKRVQGDINIAKLSMSGIIGEYFAAISNSLVGSERILAIMGRAPADNDFWGQLKKNQLAVFPPGTDPFITPGLQLVGGQDRNNGAFKKYLQYIVGQMPGTGWEVRDASIAPGTCLDKDAGTYYRSDRDFRYFSPADSQYPLTVRSPLSVNMDSSSANITLPAVSNLEQDYADLKRPVIQFTYKYWMRWSSSTRNNYYYFLPPADSKHCNLAFRLNDGWVGAHIIAVDINKVSNANNDQQSVFESNIIAKVAIDKNTYDQFMKKLNGGLKPGDQGFSSESKTKQDPGLDELGGNKIGSGDNPAATGGAGSKCRDSFKGFWDRLLIANAICGTLELLGAIAFFLANLAFSLLIYASGLQ